MEKSFDEMLESAKERFKSDKKITIVLNQLSNTEENRERLHYALEKDHIR